MTPQSWSTRPRLASRAVHSDHPAPQGALTTSLTPAVNVRADVSQKWPPGTFTPQPGRASQWNMLRAQARIELRLILRNPEQVLLTLIVPLLLAVMLIAEPFIDVGDGKRVDFVVPGILALAIMSTAFTGLAIATGFERKYGVLKRLGGTALPRSILLLAKSTAILGVQVLQTTLICLLGLAMGWRPTGSVIGAVLLVIVSTAAFGGLALLMAGTLRAETTLAGANLVWFLLLFFGGVMFPLTRFPDIVADLLRFLPTAALSEGLRAIFRDGAIIAWQDTATLLGWALVGVALAAKLFRWE